LWGCLTELVGVTLCSFEILISKLLDVPTMGFGSDVLA